MRLRSYAVAPWALCLAVLAGCKQTTICEAREYVEPKLPLRSFSAGFPEWGAGDTVVQIPDIEGRPTSLEFLDEMRVFSYWQEYDFNPGFELRYYPDDGVARTPDADGPEFPMARRSKTFSDRVRLGFRSRMCIQRGATCQKYSDEKFLIADMPCEHRFVRAW